MANIDDLDKKKLFWAMIESDEDTDNNTFQEEIKKLLQGGLVIDGEELEDTRYHGILSNFVIEHRQNFIFEPKALELFARQLLTNYHVIKYKLSEQKKSSFDFLLENDFLVSQDLLIKIRPQTTKISLEQREKLFDPVPALLLIFIKEILESKIPIVSIGSDVTNFERLLDYVDAASLTPKYYNTILYNVLFTVLNCNAPANNQLIDSMNKIIDICEVKFGIDPYAEYEQGKSKILDMLAYTQTISLTKAAYLYFQRKKILDYLFLGPNPRMPYCVDYGYYGNIFKSSLDLNLYELYNNDLIEHFFENGLDRTDYSVISSMFVNVYVMLPYIKYLAKIYSQNLEDSINHVNHVEINDMIISKFMLCFEETTDDDIVELENFGVDFNKGLTKLCSDPKFSPYFPYANKRIHMWKRFLEKNSIEDIHEGLPHTLFLICVVNGRKDLAVQILETLPVNTLLTTTDNKLLLKNNLTRTCHDFFPEVLSWYHHLGLTLEDLPKYLIGKLNTGEKSHIEILDKYIEEDCRTFGKNTTRYLSLLMEKNSMPNISQFVSQIEELGIEVDYDVVFNIVCMPGSRCNCSCLVPVFKFLHSKGASPQNCLQKFKDIILTNFNIFNFDSEIYEIMKPWIDLIPMTLADIYLHYRKLYESDPYDFGDLISMEADSTICEDLTLQLNEMNLGEYADELKIIVYAGKNFEKLKQWIQDLISRSAYVPRKHNLHIFNKMQFITETQIKELIDCGLDTNDDLASLISNGRVYNCTLYVKYLAKQL
jgi:hypothetical protein